MASYVLGIPHLSPNGLSENWHRKELGHRHWNLIAKAYGKTMAGFGSEGERPIYAAFRTVSLQGTDSGSVREYDTPDMRSTITRLSELRVFSHHVAACRDRLVADAEMSAVFVRRQAECVNRSITRVRMGSGKDIQPIPRSKTFESTCDGHGMPQPGMPPANVERSFIATSRSAKISSSVS